MLVDTRIAQAGIFIPLEFVNGIIHKIGIEDIKMTEQFKIFYIQACDFLE